LWLRPQGAGTAAALRETVFDGNRTSRAVTQPAFAPAEVATHVSAAAKPAPVVPLVPAPATPRETSDADMEHYLKGFEWRRSVHRYLVEIIDLRRKDVRQLSDQHLRTEVDALIREILQTRLQLPEDIDAEQLITMFSMRWWAWARSSACWPTDDFRSDGQ